MNSRLLALSGLALVFTTNALAFPDANVHVPDTSVEQPQDRGLRAHTNHLIYVGPRQDIDPLDEFLPTHGPAVFGSTPTGLFPARIRAAYGVPYGSTPSGGGGVIAIVIAYHYPTALNDFNVFSTQFSLPRETSSNVTSGSNSVFQVAFSSGVQPNGNGGWNQEAALDMEWTHAMAPDAKIVLVEAPSNSYVDLFNAVNFAKNITGVRCVSMSWGGGEFSSQTVYDGNLLKDGVVFFASSGDTGGSKSFPAISPNVIGVGGTHLVMSGNMVTNETVWSGSGCGVSTIEATPSFQLGVTGVTGGKRNSADIAADADPNTGCPVYDSTRYQGLSGWIQFGGTSLATPICAGLYNLSGVTSASSNAEATRLYGNRGNSSLFRDIITGSAGSFSAATGYDKPTGIGAPISGSSW